MSFSLKSKLYCILQDESHETGNMAPIEAVISGIGGAFPQSENLEEFIDNLLESKNVSTVDDSRWKPGKK